MGLIRLSIALSYEIGCAYYEVCSRPGVSEEELDDAFERFDRVLAMRADIILPNVCFLSVDGSAYGPPL